MRSYYDMIHYHIPIALGKYIHVIYLNLEAYLFQAGASSESAWASS